jgi:hypothetical protein
LYKEPCIDDVKKQRNAEYAKHINDPVLSSLKMEGIRLLLGGGIILPFDTKKALKNYIVCREFVINIDFSPLPVISTYPK